MNYYFIILFELGITLLAKNMYPVGWMVCERVLRKIKFKEFAN